MFSAFFISALYCFVFFFKNELSRSIFYLNIIRLLYVLFAKPLATYPHGRRTL